MADLDWSEESVRSLFQLPFSELMYRAETVHLENFDPNLMQMSVLLNVKTGGCSEDCAYCPQSRHYNTHVAVKPLMELDEVIGMASKAKACGATSFCIGMQGKHPEGDEFNKVLEMVKAVKSLGLKACATLGTLSQEQIRELEAVGLNYYNHNLDTSFEHYKKIVTTHRYEERLKTLENLQHSKIKICCGGIMGMNETLEDRIQFLLQLIRLPRQPDVIPINLLIKVEGTPLENAPDLPILDFIRVIAVSRILFPKTIIALAAGRNEMSEAEQTLCFLAGANAMHIGEKLLLTPLPNVNQDRQLLNRLGIQVFEK